MEDLDVDAGATSRLAVVVEGKPDPDILWYKVPYLSTFSLCSNLHLYTLINCEVVVLGHFIINMFYIV